MTRRNGGLFGTAVFEVLLPVGAGGIIAFALPPTDVGTAALGLGLWLFLLADVPWRVRFRRSALVALGWFVPATLWMVDLTAAGWLVVLVLWALLFGVAGAAVPADGRRRWAFPAAIVLAELTRWSVPFGGVPIATLAIAEVGAPTDAIVRVAGSPGLVALTAIVAVGVAEILGLLVHGGWRDRRKWVPVLVVAGVCIVGVGATALVGRAPVIDTLAVAVVQGGGPQNTRADVCENRGVFERHLASSADIDEPVDLIVWPENVVNPSADGARTPSRCTDDLLTHDEALAALTDLAVDTDAVVVTGWFEPSADGEANTNYVIAIDGEGRVTDRYDKVRLVPFGEFVPLRSTIESFSDDLPSRDVRPGTDPAVLETPLGPLGVSISWEIFFDDRARDAIRNGGQILLNPTNGSSYWLTIVQSQQVASSRLRALETDRWVLQAAPTGFSAIVTPDAEVVARTDISETAVLTGTVEMRTGTTPAVRWGWWPVLIAALATIGLARGRDVVQSAARILHVQR